MRWFVLMVGLLFATPAGAQTYGVIVRGENFVASSQPEQFTYIQGLSDGISYTAQKQACYANATVTERHAAFLNFLRDNPHRLTESAASLFIEAMVRRVCKHY